MNPWMSNAEWPPEAFPSLVDSSGRVFTEDSHETKEQAISVCRMLWKEGGGVNVIYFPIRTWVDNKENSNIHIEVSQIPNQYSQRNAHLISIEIKRFLKNLIAEAVYELKTEETTGDEQAIRDSLAVKIFDKLDKL